MSLSQRLSLPDGRGLAYTRSGPETAAVLLCLPGLLETRQTFDPLIQQAEAAGLDLQIISLDWCARGDSDPLPGDTGYAFSVYLQDLNHAIAALVPDTSRALNLLGTSMGGLLAFYYVAQGRRPVAHILLNDIGLSLDWTSILGLYRGGADEGLRQDPLAWARALRVTPGALQGVASPQHFDMPYQKSLRGMRFEACLKGFTGQLSLVHGGLSEVCRSHQVQELKQRFPQARVLSVPMAAHPVPFTPAVIDFLLTALPVPTTTATATSTATATVPPPDSATTPSPGPALGWREALRKWWQRRRHPPAP